MTMDRPFDPELMEKLPQENRFFDVNQCWYFPNRWAVRTLYPLPITANQVTCLALVSGLISAYFYFSGTRDGWMLGAVFLYGKLFLDNVDGNLARVRGEVSRIGRFLDSFSDFVVTALVYLGVTRTLVLENGDSVYWMLGGAALLSAFLQCSYWVFYYVSYTERVGSYQQNRTDESITKEDVEAVERGEESRLVLFLQTFHHLAYGWQDRLALSFDRWSTRVAGVSDSKEDQDRWYGDKTFLVLIGPLCVCTNTFGFVVCSFAGVMEGYFYCVAGVGNAYLLGLQAWKIFKSRSKS